jgi:hypothetical protein
VIAAQKSFSFALALVGFFLAPLARAEPTAEPRGGRVGWARLITPHPEWNRHTRSDSVLSNFIREKTSLNIEPTWHSADPAEVEQLCQYPLIFSTNVAAIKNPEHLKNLREYLQRGGFLLIDACSNTTVTPDPDKFLAQHTALLSKILPGSQVRALPATHEIYRSLFTMSLTPPHVYMSNRPDKKWGRHGLYGVYDENRMVAVISLSGLQCGWDNMSNQRDAEECMRMIVNIYVYAMTR